ncbi:MAG: hypothetical protein M3Z94_08170, partial [Lactobacillus panisapium]|nr:hypothetical protein [Lactobacillus panisapium]
FHGGFGLQTVDGIEKPVYRIFEIFHQLGTSRVKVTADQEKTAEVLATRKANDLQLVVYNHNVPSGKIQTEKVAIDLASSQSDTCLVQRIDDDHANPIKEWVKMGSPEYLKQDEVEQLKQAALLQNEQLTISDGRLELKMPPHSCAFVTVNNYFN